MTNKTGLPGSAEPWGRNVEKRLSKLEHKAEITDSVLDGMQGLVDKTVFADFELGQNIANGVNGTLALTIPTEVQFVSGTGLFEVTVSLGGLVMAGATLGCSFQSDEYQPDIYFGIPKWGVVASCANADVRYAPFQSSKSTVLSARPGIYKFSLYLTADTTTTASAQAFVNKAQLSVKAV